MTPIRCTVHPQDPWANWYGGLLLEVTPPSSQADPYALVAEDVWSAQSNQRPQLRWVPLKWVRVTVEAPREAVAA